MNASDRGAGPATTKPGRALTELPRRGFVLLVLLTVFWGINWPILKTGMPAIPVFTFRAICLFGGGLALLGLSRMLGHSLAVPRRQWPALLLAAVFNITIWHIATGYGVVLTEAGRSAIIAYTMPLWTVPLGFLVLHEALTWRRIVSLAFGMAGLAILMLTDEATTGGAPVGPLLMLAGALAWACGTVVMKKVAWTAPTTVLVGWQTLIGGIPILIGAALLDYSAVPFPGLWPVLALVYNVFIPFLFCYYAYYEIVRLFPVGVATIGTLAIPIVGLFSGALVLGESLGWPEYSALGLVVCALAVPVIARPRDVVIKA